MGFSDRVLKVLSDQNAQEIFANIDVEFSDIDAGTSAGQAGTIDIYPGTATRGKLAFSHTLTSSGDHTTTITNAAADAARTYTIPNSGAAADFIMSAGAQTVTGVKTHTDNIVLNTADLLIGDTDSLDFGDATGGDVAIAWDATNLTILPAADNTGQIIIGDGTTDIDVLFTLGAANEDVLFDVSAGHVEFDGVELNMGDNDEIEFGDGQDIAIQWDGSRLTSGPTIAQSSNDGLWSGCPSEIDPDPYKFIRLYDDFNQGANPDTPLALWEEIDDGTTGTNVYPSAATLHSFFSIVTAGDDNDYHSIWSAAFPFDFVNNKALWFEARFKVTEASTSQSAWWFGLSSVTTTGGFQADALGPLGTYDGVMMWKDEDALTLQCETSNASTQDTEASLGTIVSGNITRVGFHLTAAATTAVCHAYFDLSDTGTMTAHSATMNLTRSGLVPMRVVCGIKSKGSVETLDVDYIKVIQER